MLHDSPSRVFDEETTRRVVLRLAIAHLCIAIRYIECQRNCDPNAELSSFLVRKTFIAPDCQFSLDCGQCRPKGELTRFHEGLTY